MEEMTDAKSYTIVYEQYPKYLYALVHGDEYGYNVLVAFLSEIAAETRKRNLDRVLVEENISAAATREDAFRVASELPEIGFAGIRLAYIDRFQDQSDVNEFGQDVAVANGIDVRLFNDQAAADRWLSGD